MTTFDRDPLFDPRISDWLEADPDRAPEIVLETVVAALPSIPQRHASRLPWRFPAMSTFAKVAATAIAVIAIGTVGVIALQPSGGRTAGSAPSPSPRPRPLHRPRPFRL